VPNHYVRFIVALPVFFSGTQLHAAPFWEPGDGQLRHDMELVADYRRENHLITTWPMAFNADLLAADPDMPVAIQAAVARLKKKLAMSQYARTEVLTHVKVGGAKQQEPVSLRSFQSQPRAKSLVEAGIESTGDILAWRINVQWLDQPADERAGRMDGTFLGAAVGNWMITAGSLDRWWGPGWDNSLILSNYARPVPSLSISRIENNKFESRLLNWLGPWNLVISGGQLDSESSIAHVKLIGMRLTFSPAPGLEIGASRSIQWGGEGRPQDFSNFTDAILGRSNVSSANADKENSNQLGGFDIRWVSPLFNGNYTLYGQITGEDEAGFLPSQYMSLVGTEIWGHLRGARSWRLVLEHSNTHAGFLDDTADNVAYEHSTYTTGYRHFQEVIGAGIDSDARSIRLNAMLATHAGVFWSAGIRKSSLNNDDLAISPHVPQRADVTDFTIGLQSPIFGFKQNTILGAARVDDGSEETAKYFGSIEFFYEY